MNRLIAFLFTGIFFLPLAITAQTISFSDYEREDSRDLNFEVIGKMNGNFLVYKSIHWNHKISVFDNEMNTKEIVKLDFVPEKTFNADFITYNDFFYMIYQYQKRNIVHCMAVKLDANGKKMSEPVELDTTQIPVLADNKIYTTVYSEDKQQIMVFKIQKKGERFNIATLLLDNQLHEVKRTRESMYFDERRDNYGDFMIDNEGNFIFTIDNRQGERESSNSLKLVTKAPLADTFAYHTIDLQKQYIDEVKLKIDNLNKRYIINSLYYPKSRGSIAGLFTCIWEPKYGAVVAQIFNVFDENFRAEAHSEGLLRFAFDDFFIHHILVRKDGGFLLTAEDFSSQTRGSNNPWNRWDYLSNYSMNSGFYSYNPYYGYYRPFSNYNNSQSIRYYYDNIIVLSLDKYGKFEWSKVIHKSQYDDDDDNFLSFATMNWGGEIHFLFNADTRYQVISDQSISADGSIKRNATLKSQEKGYEFMPKLSKQVGARQLIVPCSYRGYICFAKVDF